jgi:hypothetical protein
MPITHVARARTRGKSRNLARPLAPAGVGVGIRRHPCPRLACPERRRAQPGVVPHSKPGLIRLNLLFHYQAHLRDPRPPSCKCMIICDSAGFTRRRGPSGAGAVFWLVSASLSRKPGILKGLPALPHIIYHMLSLLWPCCPAPARTCPALPFLLTCFALHPRVPCGKPITLQLSINNGPTIKSQQSKSRQQGHADGGQAKGPGTNAAEQARARAQVQARGSNFGGEPRSADSRSERRRRPPSACKRRQ